MILIIILLIILTTNIPPQRCERLGVSYRKHLNAIVAIKATTSYLV